MYALTPFERKSFDLFNAFHDFENDFFGNTALTSFKTDLRDEGDKFVMEAELPGFEKEDISLDITGDTLKLSAQHKEENADKEGGKYVYRERSYGAYERTFDISAIDADNIDAEYKNGILYLNLPKKATTQSQTKRLEIK